MPLIREKEKKDISKGKSKGVEKRQIEEGEERKRQSYPYHALLIWLKHS